MNKTGVVYPDQTQNLLLGDTVPRKGYLRHVLKFVTNMKRLVVVSHSAVPQLQTKGHVESVQGFPNDTNLVSVLLFFILISKYLQIFYQGFLFSYSEFALQDIKLPLQLLFLALALASVLLNFLLFRERRGQILVNLSDIVNDYFFNQLWIDSIIIILQITNCIFDKGYINVVLFFLLIHQVKRSFHNFQVSFVTTQQRQSIWRLSYLFLFNFLVAELIAVVFNAMTFLNAQKNWILQNKLQTAYWFDRYLWTIYWSITTLMTVGYGDLTPSTPAQSIIVGILEMMGGIVFAYNINMIGNSISRFYKQNEELNFKMRLARNLFRREGGKGISLCVKNQILSSIKNNIFNSQARDISSQEEIVQSLQPSLKKRLLLILRKDLLSRLPFLSLLTSTFREKLANSLQKLIYCNQQMLCLAFKKNTHLIMLERGIAQTVIPNFNTSLNLEKKADTSLLFGLRTFLTRGKQHLSVRSKGICEVFAIQLNFLQSLLKNKLDRQRLCHQRDSSCKKHFNYQDLCSICQKERHSLAVCPKYHYQPLKLYTVIKICKNQSHRGQSEYRRTSVRRRVLSRKQRRVFEQLPNIVTQETHLEQQNIFQNMLSKYKQNNIGGEEFEKNQEYRYYFPQNNLERQVKLYNSLAVGMVSLQKFIE